MKTAIAMPLETANPNESAIRDGRRRALASLAVLDRTRGTCPEVSARSIEPAGDAGEPDRAPPAVRRRG